MSFLPTLDEKSISNYGRKGKGGLEEKQTRYLPDLISLGQIPREEKIAVATKSQRKAKIQRVFVAGRWWRSL